MKEGPSNFHALYDVSQQAMRSPEFRTSAPPSTETLRMAGEDDASTVHYDEATNQPKLIRFDAPDARFSMRTAGPPPDAASAAKGFFDERRDLWGLSEADAAAIEVSAVSEKGLKTVNLLQRVDGVDVFNSDLNVGLDSDNRILSVAGQPFAGLTDWMSQRGRGAGPELIPVQEAIAKAARDLTGFQFDPSEFPPSTARESESGYHFHDCVLEKKEDDRPDCERPVRVKKVIFPLGEGRFALGYYLELWLADHPPYSYVMDATRDEAVPDILYRKNLMSRVAFTYRVFNTGDALKRPTDGPAPGTPHPIGTPNGFQAPPIPSQLITVESLLTPSDPWLPSGATTTDGNNCIAYADLKPPNGFGPGDVKGATTAANLFGKDYDHSKPASDPENLQNSIVGMFFHVNWLHDRWYEAGFDEASGNAQKNNFGRGGLGGDPILAEGNDFSGTDNATMTTPSDGASPRMQMFEFKGTAPLVSRTSNHEALITFHEMGHYITNRLVGNANGLTNQQGGAMGEGWGDFFAICMTSQPTDNFATGVFAAGGWTDITSTFKQNYYFSIRRYPYSADMTKNPLTFKHISNSVVLPPGPPAGPPRRPNGSSNSEEHNAGEIWCTALWEVFVNLVKKHGHANAEQLMLEYVIGGLKLTPPQPTFLQARDAIFAAVSAMRPLDLPDVKAGFAKRGMGNGAVAPPAFSTTFAGVVESFIP
jgi:extracellular elastinolytic metalloproteinase